MTRVPTSGVLLLLLMLLATPAAAQVIMGGSPLGIPGSGTVTSIATASPITGGTITSSGTIACATCTTSAGMTTGLFPVASGAHALVDSVFGQNTSAIVKTGSTAAVGGIGFNQAGNVEVIADGSTVVNAGLFSGTKSDFTIHDSTTENNWQFLIYNDDNGINNGVVLQNYGASPNNSLQIVFGNGVGGTATVGQGTSFTQLQTLLGAPSLSVGNAIVNGGATNSMAFNLVSTVFGLGQSNTFAINDGTSTNAFIVQHTGTSSIGQMSATNNAGTATAGHKSQISGNASTSKSAIASLEVLDDIDDVSLNLNSPRANGITQGSVALQSTHVGAGNQPYFVFQTPENNGHAFAFQAPDSVAAGFISEKLPNALATANGQPWVGTTAGVLSHATGATIGTADVTVIGHYLSSTTTPAVTNTTANSCGTTAATIVGTDVAGKVTVGATAGTSCTVTFTTAFANAPACSVTNETTANLSRATSTTTTVILAGTFVAGDKLAYICMGRV